MLVVLVVYTSQNGTSLSFRPTCSSKYMILSGYSLDSGSVEQNSPVGDAELGGPLDVGGPLGFQYLDLLTITLSMIAQDSSLSRLET